jgi:hypothetical protein
MPREAPVTMATLLVPVAHGFVLLFSADPFGWREET